MLGALILALAEAASALFDPATGYRVAAYRGVVVAPPPGVPRIDDAQAAREADEGKTLVIDVGPAPGASRDAGGAWYLPEPHETIPGAHWFPEVGRGPTNPVLDQWFAKGVLRLTRRSKARPIIVFCLADCWMSWNAAWKLKRLGYTHVEWYANGVDGWREMGRQTTIVLPEP